MANTSSVETGSGRRFSLVRVLGEGSFGTVYLAEMEGAGGFRRRVALKLLNSTWDPESDAGRRLRDEARLLGRLDHRNIVRVDDLVQLTGRWALVMEYVSGADMQAIFETAEVDERPLPPHAVAEVGISVAAALVAAWTTPGGEGQPLAVVHRDIKPSNIRLSDTGEVKVLDFGVARAAFTGREARTERVRYGSLGYMSPERLLGEAEGPEGDIYALGVMLYELLTLRTYGRVELGLDQQAAQVRAAHEALVAVIGDGPTTALIVSTLAYQPWDRPTASEVEERLRDALKELPGLDLVSFARQILPKVQALGGTGTTENVAGRVLEEAISRPRADGAARPQVSSATLVVSQVDAEPADTASAPIAAPTPSRSSMPLVLGAVVAVLAFVLLGVLLFPRGDRTATPVATPTDARPAPAAAPAVASPPPAAPPVAPPVAPAVASPDPVATTGAAATGAKKSGDPAASKPTGTAAHTHSLTGARAAHAPASPGPEAAPAVALTAGSSGATRLRAAKFSLVGAENIRVTCGDVTGAGASSALLRDFPAGACNVVVSDRLRTQVQVDSPRGVTCTVEGDSLACR